MTDDLSPVILTSWRVVESMTRSGDHELAERLRQVLRNLERADTADDKAEMARSVAAFLAIVVEWLEKGDDRVE